MYAIEDFSSAIADIPHSTDRMTVRTKSRDHYTISPLLREALAGKTADIVVSPRSKADLIKIVRAAVHHRIPMTMRGGGTANYGQSVPTRGGILLDMTAISGVLWVRGGHLRALAGTLTTEVDIAARLQGWELRIHPSTRSTGTLAGFVAGGSGGMGSCMWGMLRDRGNITGMEVISAEEEPRVMELRGRDVDLIHHAYGTNAIMTEVEMPVAPAFEWRETIVAFRDFIQATRFGVQLGRETGIIKKLISLQEWPVPRLMSALSTIVPEGHSMANCMIAQPSFEAFECVVEDFDGIVVSNWGEGKGPYGAPLYEFAYGHGLRQVQRSNSKYTGLQGLFGGDDVPGMVARVHKRFGGPMPMRLEIFHSDGSVVGMGSPYFLYESDGQVAEVVDFMQAEGVQVANNHANTVRDVGIKVIDHRDAAFKASMDPHGLLNPGKLDFDDDAPESTPHALATQGWNFKKVG
jgi:hypothetical protein